MTRWILGKRKYHNTPTVLDGKKFDSKKESEYYQTLLILKRGGEVKEIELQPEFMLQEGFRHRGKAIRAIKYRADFRVTYKDGHVEVVDVKSWATLRDEVYRIKKKLLLKRYPDINFVEIT